MKEFVKEISLQLAQRGYQTAIVSTQHLLELREEIERRLEQGMLNKEFFQERLSWFNFEIPENLPKAKSLIVVAVPRPQTEAVFTWNGKSKPLTLPPTYTAYRETTKQILDLLAEILSQNGYHAARTALPLKLLAVRSGLAQYGRNNICYVSGMGSFLQLVAVYSELPIEEDCWQEARVMKSCENCELCRLACPTGAIPSDRFLLRVERCIVYHNEKKADIPFPEWLNPLWHNCVVGCLHCQRACPENKNFLKWVGEREQFSEEETSLLLEITPRDQLPTATITKLEHLSLTDYIESLPRNLAVFFRKMKT